MEELEQTGTVQIEHVGQRCELRILEPVVHGTGYDHAEECRTYRGTYVAYQRDRRGGHAHVFRRRDALDGHHYGGAARPHPETEQQKVEVQQRKVIRTAYRGQQEHGLCYQCGTDGYPYPGPGRVHLMAADDGCEYRSDDDRHQ